MKKTIIALALLLVTSGSATTAYANEGHGKKTKKEVKAKKYTCPMHPEVVSSKPGKCPKCGMKLVLTGSKKIK